MIPSQDMMDGLYAHAYEFINCVDDFRMKLRHSFRFLHLRFYNPDYTIGLATVCQLKNNFESADLYAVAFTLLKMIIARFYRAVSIINA